MLFEMLCFLESVLDELSEEDNDAGNLTLSIVGEEVLEYDWLLLDPSL